MTTDRIPLHKADYGEWLVIQDRFDDGAGTVEIRESYYQREPGPVFYTNFEAVIAFGCVQGVAGEWPRVHRLVPCGCVDPGEMHRATLVQYAELVTVFPDIFKELRAGTVNPIGLSLGERRGKV